MRISRTACDSARAPTTAASATYVADLTGTPGQNEHPVAEVPASPTKTSCDSPTVADGVTLCGSLVVADHISEARFTHALGNTEFLATAKPWNTIPAYPARSKRHAELFVTGGRKIED